METIFIERIIGSLILLSILFRRSQMYSILLLIIVRLLAILSGFY